MWSNSLVEDFNKVVHLICPRYKDFNADSLDTARVRSLITSNKLEEMPQTSDAAKIHIVRGLPHSKYDESKYLIIHNYRACIMQMHDRVPNKFV